MGTMLKPRCNHRSGWGKGLHDQKKQNESVKDQGDVGCDFWLERHCPLSDGKQTVVPGSFSVFEDAVHRKGTELWKSQTWMFLHDNPPGHVSPLIRSYLVKHQTSVRPHPPYSLDLAPADFSCFPNLKPLWKDVISKLKRRFRKTW